MKAVVTQNVDGLHSAAGSQRVIELHGKLRHVVRPAITEEIIEFQSATPRVLIPPDLP